MIEACPSNAQGREAKTLAAGQPLRPLARRVLESVLVWCHVKPRNRNPQAGPRDFGLDVFGMVE